MKFALKFILTLSVICLVFSCKKSSDSSSSSYYVKAKFDGTEKQFTGTVLAMKSNLAPGIVSLSITALNGTTEEAIIQLWSDKDDFVAGKTFTIDAPSASSYNIFGYTAPIGSSDPANIWTSTYDLGVEDQSFSCTITEATSAYIKGTFSSVIWQQATPAVSKTITEGSFYAKF